MTIDQFLPLLRAAFAEQVAQIDTLQSNKDKASRAFDRAVDRVLLKALSEHLTKGCEGG